MAQEAVFPIKYPTDTSGIDRGISALDRMRKAIQDDRKELQALQSTMQTLKLDPNVQAFEKATAGLRKAQDEAGKLKGKLDELQAARATATPAAAAKIDTQIADTTKKFDAQTAAADRYKKKLGELEKVPIVQQYKDLGKVAKETQARLVGNQAAFTKAGGDLTKLGEAVKGPKQGLEGLAEGAGAAGGPIGGLAQKFQQLKALGPAGLIVAAVVALVALTVAAVKAAFEFGKFILAAADASRSAAIIREAVTGSEGGARALEGSIGRVRQQVAGTREELEGAALELQRSGLAGADLERTMRLSQITAKTMGDAASGILKGLVDRGALTKKFALNPLDLRGTGLAFKDVARQLAKQMGIAVGAAEAALQNGQVKLTDGIAALDQAVKVRFGDLAKRQLVALPNQLARAKENLRGIFANIDPGRFLAGLASVLELLDETTATGKALRTLAKTIFQPMLDGASRVFPLVRAFILGASMVLLDFAILALKAYIQLKNTFGNSTLFKNLDATKIAFYAGAAAVVVLVGALLVLAAVLTPLAIVAFLVSLPFLLLGAALLALGAVVLFVVAWISDGLNSALNLFGLGVPRAKKMGESLTGGLIAGIKAKSPELASTLAGLVPAGLDAFQGAAKIKSPSRLFAEEGGRYIAEGVAVGVDENAPAVGSSIASLADPSPLQGGGRGGAGALRGGSGPLIGELHVHPAAGSGPAGIDMVDLVQKLAEALENAGRQAGILPTGAT
jgi:hypothetical protein